MEINKEYLQGYVSGLVEMAAVHSDNLGFSDMTAVWLGKSNYIEAAAQEIGCSPDMLEGHVIDEPLVDHLCLSFGDDMKGIQAACDLVKKLRTLFDADVEIIEFTQHDELCELYSGYSGGRGPYFIVETMFLVRFEKAALLFVRGSDE